MRLALALLLLSASVASAQEPPVPKMFQGLHGQKGQWQVEFLEASGRAGKGRLPAMTVCTDNLMKSQEQRGTTPRDAPRCTHKLVRDTANEAIVESECPDSKNRVVMTREGPKTFLLSATSSGPRGERSSKMRYSHLGACREGQGAVTMDPNSEQCRKMKERAAKLDPEKACARSKGDRAECEQRVRDTAKQFSAMCG
jgi:hypothetical protein